MSGCSSCRFIRRPVTVGPCNTCVEIVDGGCKPTIYRNWRQRNEPPSTRPLIRGTTAVTDCGKVDPTLEIVCKAMVGQEQEIQSDELRAVMTRTYTRSFQKGLTSRPATEQTTGEPMSDNRQPQCAPEDYKARDPQRTADALTQVLTERGARYGQFKDQAVYADRINYVMQSSPNWDRMACDQRESLRIIANKIGRILNGDPNYDDSWVDIAGYAKLIADRLQGTAR